MVTGARAEQTCVAPEQERQHLGKAERKNIMKASSSVSYLGSGTHYIDAPNLGPRSGVPLILFNHWGAVLDNFDPRIVDGLASKHRVIATDYRGIGASGGTAPVTIDEMARDAIALIRALGFEKVDLLGFSLGGFVAQDIVLKAPDLVRKLILTGTGRRAAKVSTRWGRCPGHS